jgi:2-methylcitrate dehydratase PrpD
MRDDPTRALAEFALDLSSLPPQSLRQARRAFTNYLGCSLGGVHEPAAVHALALADEFSGPRTATVHGRQLRLDPLHAALVNCVQSSIQTFDDTHLASVIHPTGPVAAALLALLEHSPRIRLDGQGFLAALGVGIEVSCRVALALTAPPAQPHLGLFMTGITGGVGAAAACARVLGLDLLRTQWAIGTAAAQAGGLRATHTTMAGGLVPALGARAGLESTLLAQKGFDGPPGGLEHPNGLFAVFAPGANTALALQGLGDSFELDDLSYKPYPCGVVIHPVIDACLDLLPQMAGEAIERVHLQVHPLVLQLTGTRHPAHALACNASVYHWAAAALVRGRASMAEASEAALHEPAIAALRERIEALPMQGLGRDEAHVKVALASGRVLQTHVPHARGSRDRPLTDSELQAKVLGMASPVLGERQACDLLAACNTLAEAGPDWVGPFLATTVPARYP